MKTISKELREYLADYYTKPSRHIVDPDDDIRVSEEDCECVEVYGVMPNTDYIGWFDAGIIDGLEQEMKWQAT